VVAAVVGWVYLVDDDQAHFVPDEGRIPKDGRRRFVVLSDDPFNTDDSWPLVLAAPVSGASQRSNPLSVELLRGEAGCTKRCWIFLDQTQALPKAALQDKVGSLSEEKLTLVRGRLLGYLGMHKSTPPAPSPLGPNGPPQPAPLQVARRPPKPGPAV
jgi:mRNA-degrading endonuclease toxin of MazEF toxin-antitoxin module